MATQKPNLTELKALADKASDDFDAACRPHYCDGRWGAYRAIECEQKVPQSVLDAMDAYRDATRAFYGARDGDGGFLGSRGL